MSVIKLLVFVMAAVFYMVCPKKKKKTLRLWLTKTVGGSFFAVKILIGWREVGPTLWFDACLRFKTRLFVFTMFNVVGTHSKYLGPENNSYSRF